MNFQYFRRLNIALLAGSISVAALAGAIDYPVGSNSAKDALTRVAPITYESFEGAGWNASRITGTYTPGLKSNLPKSFRFTQFQGPHSFDAESSITRIGKFSAKLHWKQGDPAKWNDDPNVIDNADRKAMIHGTNASNNTATSWYGFSVYFPSNFTKFSGDQEALFFQLHGAPDNNGEPSRVPPVALTMLEDGFKIGYAWDTNKKSPSPRGEGHDSFVVPVDLKDYQDRWVDFVIQVHTNPFEKKAFINVWIDGKQKVNRTNIQLGYNDTKGIYPSWGWYLFEKNALRTTDVILYLDEVRMVENAKADYFDVAPGYFKNKNSLPANATPTAPQGPNKAFTFSAPEGGKVKISGLVNVAYGANGKFHYAYNQTQDLECSNRTFGDPIPSVKKSCFVRVKEETKPAQPTTPTTPKKPTTAAPSSCQHYSGTAKTEIDLAKGSCINLPKNLKGQTLQVWDSDIKGCDFRGVVNSVDGSGKLVVDENYESSINLTGTTILFEANNSCKYVQMRVF